MTRNATGRSIQGDRTFDTAAMLAGLKVKGLSTREMMAQTGLAMSTINNRLRVFKNLSRDLLTEFAAGNLTTMEAERLAKFRSHAMQWSEYKRGAPRNRRLRISETRQLLDACSKSSRSESWKRGAADALRCVLGETTIEGVWPPLTTGRDS